MPGALVASIAAQRNDGTALEEPMDLDSTVSLGSTSRESVQLKAAIKPTFWRDATGQGGAHDGWLRLPGVIHVS